MATSIGETILTPESSSKGKEPEVEGKKMLVFDMTEKAVVKAMEAITSEQLIAFVSLLEVVQTDQIDISLYAIFEFQGFDPHAVIRKLLVINKHYRDTLGKTEETLEKLREDVMFMIAANIYMGNLQKKSLSRRSAEGRTMVSTLVAKYAMKIGTTRAGLASDTLTFPRVANAFPVLATRMASVLPSKDFPQGIFQTAVIPKFMRISAFASFCDAKIEERTRLFLLHCVCAYSCDQTIIVHEGRKREKRVKKDEDVMTPVDAYGLQWNFISVASTSPVPKEQMKRAMMTEYQVASMYENLKGVVQNFRTLVGDPSPLPSKGEYEKDITDFISTASG